MIACAGLACAMLLHARRTSGWSRRAAFVVACLAITLFVTARPAYLPLAFTVLLADTVSMRRRAAGLSGILAAVIGWVAIVKTFTLTAAAGARATAQLHAALFRPMRVGRILLHTVTVEGGTLVRQFIGVLGWLDTPLPGSLYVLGVLWLMLSFLAGCPTDEPWTGGARQGIVLLCMAGSVVAVFAVQYLTWTSSGAAVIEGVQGRYFIPVALFLPLVLPKLSAVGRIRSFLAAGVVLLPCALLALTIRAIVYRYYL